MVSFSVFIWQIRGFSTGQAVVKQKHWVMAAVCCSYLFLRPFNFLSDVHDFNLKQYFFFFLMFPFILSVSNLIVAILK